MKRISILGPTSCFGTNYLRFFSVYLLATMYNTQTLRRYCLSFMIQPENFDAIIKTDAFANLDKESILDVLKARPVSTTQLLRRT